MKIAPFKITVLQSEYEMVLQILNRFGYDLRLPVYCRDFPKYIYLNEYVEYGYFYPAYLMATEPELTYDEFRKLYDK